jgi:hypothetical protein
MIPVVATLCAADAWIARIGPRWRGSRLLALSVLAVILPSEVIAGHPEDIAALACLLCAVASASGSQIG